MKKEEQAYTAQEEEPSLLFAEIESTGGGGGNSGEDGHHDGAGGLEGEHAAGQVQDPISVCAPAGAPFKAAAAAGEKGSIASVPGGERKVHIVEEKVFTALSDEGGKDPRRWVLDTGASNQTTGSRAAFASIDAGTIGTMHFGDGSVVQIEGRGTILYQCKTGKHHALPNVYFIPRLDTNIISVGQLDEDGHEVKNHRGVMQIREEDGRLLARIL
jgi:hypothetical protein